MSVQARTQLKKNIDKMEAHADPVKLAILPMRSTSCQDRSSRRHGSYLRYRQKRNCTCTTEQGRCCACSGGHNQTRVDIKNLRLLKSNNKPAKDRFSSTRNVPSRMDVRPETEVDVRGETAFDAINIVDKAIDNAVLRVWAKWRLFTAKARVCLSVK